MEEIKAPENIYFTLSENGIHYYSEGVPLGQNSIKYVRADTFIEKACEWLKNNYLKYPSEDWVDTTKFVTDFELYIKGE